MKLLASFFALLLAFVFPKSENIPAADTAVSYDAPKAVQKTVGQLQYRLEKIHDLGIDKAIFSRCPSGWYSNYNEETQFVNNAQTYTGMIQVELGCRILYAYAFSVRADGSHPMLYGFTETGEPEGSFEPADQWFASHSAAIQKVTKHARETHFQGVGRRKVFIPAPKPAEEIIEEDSAASPQ